MRHLPIAFIADKNFFLPTVVAITSLLENKNQDSQYKIYIVCVGFLQQQLEVIAEIEKKYNTEIEITEVDEQVLRDKYKGLVKHDCNATVSALIKFDLPDICAEEKYLLYLDGDIIVKEDLMFFDSLELDDNTYVAAVKDSGLLYSQRLVRQEIENYFNSGVMYLNLDAMRKNGISEQLVKAKMNATDNSLMDQHVLNEIFNAHKIMIDYKYNTLYVNLRRAHYFHGLSLKKVNDFCNTDYRSWDDILEEASIVHYSSFDKPWKYSDVNGVELWDAYYKKSIIYDENIKRKRLNTKKFEKVMSIKLLVPFGAIAWEIKTKGFKKAYREIAGKIFKK